VKEFNSKMTSMKFKSVFLFFTSVSLLLIIPSIVAQSANTESLTPLESNSYAKLISVTDYNINLELNKDQKLISPFKGSLHLACFNESSASLRLISEKGLTIFIYPVQYSSIKVKLGQDLAINQSDFLGQLNSVFPINDKCDPVKGSGLNITTRKAKCPFQMVNQTLNCGDVNKIISGTYQSAIPKDSSCNSTLAMDFSIGQRNAIVTKLQQCLKDLGLFNYPGGITGFFGNYTNTVYNAFLKTNTSICQILKSGNYTLGERSERVKRLQQCLREANKFNYPTNTGMFGPITQAGFRSWN
jgi:hypothetical protein